MVKHLGTPADGPVHYTSSSGSLSGNGLEDEVVVSPSPTVPPLRPSQSQEAVVLWTAAGSVTTGEEHTVGVVGSGPGCLGQGYLALF